jgi:SAM-dependent methyltransferase
MLVLYTLTIFVGAALLFLVQPMVGRMVLPLLGGSPAVWNTAMVFYQAVLLSGYAYAHFATRRLAPRRQVLVHFIVLLLPLLVLPIGIPKGWTPPTAHNPIPWLLALLLVAAGLPFFAVSVTSPLLQRWFSTSGHRGASDPYFLYAASNCGSLLALVGYPVLIEPHMGLAEQSRWWMVGYGLLVALTVACGLWLRRTAPGPASVTRPSEEARLSEQLTASRRLRWVLLALVPCSLMLSVTTYITSEVAPIPLLWVIPLGVYLLSFILVFAKKRLLPHRWMIALLPFAVAAVVYTLVARMVQPIGWLIGMHLAGLFIVAMVCHGELANDRPAPEHLTEFYLWMSVGGVIGGMFNALLAPLLFSTVLEYPLSLVLACLLAPGLRSNTQSARARLAGACFAVMPGLLGAVLLVITRNETSWPPDLAKAVMYGVPAALCLVFLRRPVRFGLSIFAVLLACWLVPGYKDQTLCVERSFFGIHHVSLDPTGRYHWLSNGNTIHGVQSLEPSRRDVPLAYFTQTGPFGQAYAALPDELKQRVGVIGLGAGSLSCYAKPGEDWTFFEIDPLVERIARDPRYFSFLDDSRADVHVLLGDARLSLRHVPDNRFGVLELDAYSSDTIPLHLITREALALYLQKLAPNGLLIFHISNRHLRLERVFAVLAQDAHLACLVQADPPGGPNELLETGKIASKWVIMARDRATFGPLANDPRWKSPPPRLKTALWTDDYASVFSVFMW